MKCMYCEGKDAVYDFGRLWVRSNATDNSAAEVQLNVHGLGFCSSRCAKAWFEDALEHHKAYGYEVA